MKRGLFGVLLIGLSFELSGCAIRHTRGGGDGGTVNSSGSFSKGAGLQEETRHRILYEQSLKTKREKEQYSEILPLFKDESERLDFLNLKSLEERQAWIKANNLWARNAELYKQYKTVIDAQDITVGMTQELVKKSWGDPQGVEVSGNPIYKNERWRFSRNVSTPEGFKKEDRWVYFESGRVIGWETKTN
ncbi:MAG TPA: hypothetical protein PLJ21_07615 [Pseudobdellovibrionaceae bacterium]|nr:hypothetical protein [Pseudobdellovibrionaceae bacterium]